MATRKELEEQIEELKTTIALKERENKLLMERLLETEEKLARLERRSSSSELVASSNLERGAKRKARATSDTDSTSHISTIELLQEGLRRKLY